VAPHAVEQHGELARDSDERFSCPHPLGQGAAPDGKLGGPRGAPKHDIGCFVEVCPQHRVTTARDMTGAAHRAGLETPRRQTETGCDRTRRSNTASCSRVVSRTTSIGLDDRGEHGVLRDPLPHHRFETAALSPPRIMPKVLSNPRMPFVVAAALWRGLTLTAASTTAVAHSCAAASLALPGICNGLGDSPRWLRAWYQSGAIRSARSVRRLQRVIQCGHRGCAPESLAKDGPPISPREPGGSAYVLLLPVLSPITGTPTIRTSI